MRLHVHTEFSSHIYGFFIVALGQIVVIRSIYSYVMKFIHIFRIMSNKAKNQQQQQQQRPSENTNENTTTQYSFSHNLNSEVLNIA